MFGKLLSTLNRRHAEEPAEAAGIAPKRAGTGGLTVTRIGLVVVIVSVALLGAVAAALQLQFAAERQSQAEGLSRAKAEAVGQHLAGRVAALGDGVAALASAPALVEAVRTGDADALDAFRERVVRMLPGSTGVRVIRPGMHEPDSVQALGYACLDLARQAEAGKRPPLELHFAGAEAQHLEMVRPVRSGEEVIASLAVTLDRALAQRWLAEAIPEGGYAELLQIAGGNRLTVGKAGAADARSGAGHEVPVPGTSWLVAYWVPPKAAAVETDGSVLVFVAAAAVAIALIVLGGFVLVDRLLSRDVLELVDHFVGVFIGQRTHSVSMKLVEVQKAVGMMDEALASADLSRKPMASPAAPSAPEDGGYVVSEEAPVPDLMYVSKDSVTVDELATDPQERKD